MQSFPHFTSRRDGIALIEFALLFPLLLLMLVGAIEIARYAILHQKLDKATNSMADFVTQGNSVSMANLDAFAATVPQIVEPFNFSGSVIFTSVSLSLANEGPCAETDFPCISWQYAPVGTNSSLIGSVGGAANLPGGYIMTPLQNIIVAELFLDYTPMLTFTGDLVPALGPQQLYKVAVFKPRQGPLITLN